MSNSTLRVLAAHRPPLVFADQGHGIFTGFLIDLLPALLHQAGVQMAFSIHNFTVSSITPLQ